VSVATSLRDATTGHITLDQSPRSESGWEATAQLKPIIAMKLYGVSATWQMTGGVADGPFDALVELARQCSQELWRFEVAITRKEVP
jgi:hypothetical protein